MIATALEAEVADYVERFADERDEDGKRLVVRNGRARERKLTVGSGTVPIGAPSQRQARRRADWRAPALLVEDLAGVRQAVAEGQRRVAGAVSARPVDRGLPPGLGAAAR